MLTNDHGNGCWLDNNCEDTMATARTHGSHEADQKLASLYIIFSVSVWVRDRFAEMKITAQVIHPTQISC